MIKGKDRIQPKYWKEEAHWLWWPTPVSKTLCKINKCMTHVINGVPFHYLLWSALFSKYLFSNAQSQMSTRALTALSQDRKGGTLGANISLGLVNHLCLLHTFGCRGLTFLVLHSLIYTYLHLVMKLGYMCFLSCIARNKTRGLGHARQGSGNGLWNPIPILSLHFKICFYFL